MTEPRATTPQPGTDPLATAIEAAARAVCSAFGGDPAICIEMGVHREGARVAVRAAAPHIPVSDEQREAIERDALLRAADELPSAKPGDDELAALAVEACRSWLRARAQAVGTETR